jgi:putative spermidine/putrescine transport system permease protein/spermidine/putrescine transport system permease protein
MVDQERIFGWLHRGFAALFIVYMLVPLAVTAIMAFSDDSFVRFPIRNYSLRYFADFFNDPKWISAAWNSLHIAVLTAVLSMVLAVPAAYALSRARRPVVQTLILIPLFVPSVVLGISVAIGLGGIEVFGTELFGSKFLVACAHTLWALPLAITVLEPSFSTMDRSLIEAAGDLGASPLRAFFGITVPIVMTGIVSAALFAFITSMNEFIMALFLTTRDTQTLPVLLWLSLRSSASPILAVASIILAGSVFSIVALAYVWYAALRRR